MKIVEKEISTNEVATKLKLQCERLWTILQSIDGPEPVSIKHLHPVTNNLFAAIDAVESLADSLITGKQRWVETNNDEGSH